MTNIKAIITTLDNLENLQDSVAVLRDDPLVDEIVVVNNGSIDGTREWLDGQSDLTVIHRENHGAGPRRHWLPLQPGNNTLEYTETGAVGLTITVEWEKRWY